MILCVLDYQDTSAGFNKMIMRYPPLIALAITEQFSTSHKKMRQRCCQIRAFFTIGIRMSISDVYPGHT